MNSLNIALMNMINIAKKPSWLKFYSAHKFLHITNKVTVILHSCHGPNKLWCSWLIIPHQHSCTIIPVVSDIVSDTLSLTLSYWWYWCKTSEKFPCSSGHIPKSCFDSERHNHHAVYKILCLVTKKCMSPCTIKFA